MAVEFVDHAASAHIARHKGWFEDEGLHVTAFNNYITGMALASALSKGDVNAAYICMIPPISAYANANVPLKVVCGTHTHGYGLVADPEKIKSIQDLEKSGIRIGCPREGSPVDTIMHKTIDKYSLNKENILQNVRRMPPPMILLSLKSGQLDAGFCCEQFPTVGEEAGFKEILRAKDVWPGMQGSVLVVTDDLIQNHPEIVRKLVKVTQKGIQYIHEYPEEAAAISANALRGAGKEIFPLQVGNISGKLEITPKVILSSLTQKMECTTAIDPQMIQEEIHYMAELGYIKKSFHAEDILNLSFLKELEQ
jgi:NitT/TauT family transport system substrate-binding protein